MRSALRPIPGLLLVLLTLVTRPAAGQGYSDPGLGLGGHLAFSRSTDADSAAVSGGAQARLRLTGGLGLEGLIGFRHEQLGPLRVTEIPVQGSVLVFFLTSKSVQPYVLGGGGYYWVRVTGIAPGDGRKIESLFGLHAGAGVDVRVSRRTSVFADGRYVSLQSPSVEDAGRKADYWTAALGLNLYF